VLGGGLRRGVGTILGKLVRCFGERSHRKAFEEDGKIQPLGRAFVIVERTGNINVGRTRILSKAVEPNDCHGRDEEQGKPEHRCRDNGNKRLLLAFPVLQRP
jgi:hypothetical protein